MGWAGITVSCRFLLLSVRSNQSDAERTKPAGSYDNARIHAAFSIWKKTRCLIAHPSPCIRGEGRVGGELWRVIRKQPRPIRHWCIRRWGRTRGARLVGSRGWKMTAPPLRSTSLDARTFAFTPGSNERKILRGGGREKAAIILEPNRRDRRAILSGAHYGKLVSLPRRCCEQRLIPIDLLVITRRLCGGGGKKEASRERRIPSFLVLWYRGIWISTSGSRATYILYRGFFHFILFSSLSSLHISSDVLSAYCTLTQRGRRGGYCKNCNSGRVRKVVSRNFRGLLVGVDGREISDGVSNGDIAGSAKFWRGMPLTVVLRARVTRAPCQWYNAE